jgi:hypothetical protein
MTDHQDPVFISERMRQLSVYLTELVIVPHVADMTCTKSFLGLMDQVPSARLVLYTKQETFNCLFFSIHVLPHPDLQMGNRGLIGKEKEGGVILAFGATACKDIASEEEYLYAELQFGMKWEKLLIPWDSIFRIFDKSQNALTQLRVVKESLTSIDKPKTSKKKAPKESTESNVIQIDFSRKK